MDDRTFCREFDNKPDFWPYMEYVNGIMLFLILAILFKKYLPVEFIIDLQAIIDFLDWMKDKNIEVVPKR